MNYCNCDDSCFMTQSLSRSQWRCYMRQNFFKGKLQMTWRMRTTFSFVSSGLMLTAVGNRSVTTDVSRVRVTTDVSRVRANIVVDSCYDSEPWDPALKFRVLVKILLFWVDTHLQNAKKTDLQRITFEQESSHTHFDKVWVILSKAFELSFTS